MSHQASSEPQKEPCVEDAKLVSGWTGGACNGCSSKKACSYHRSMETNSEARTQEDSVQVEEAILRSLQIETKRVPEKPECAVGAEGAAETQGKDVLEARGEKENGTATSIETALDGAKEATETDARDVVEATGEKKKERIGEAKVEMETSKSKSTPAWKMGLACLAGATAITVWTLLKRPREV